MGSASKSLMIVVGENGPPTFEAAAAQLAVRPDAIDREFGIVPVDPKAHTYSVLVELPCTDDRRAFSNPKIAPLKP
jgi:hypothetical protein